MENEWQRRADRVLLCLDNSIVSIKRLILSSQFGSQCLSRASSVLFHSRKVFTSSVLTAGFHTRVDMVAVS
jgi:hypothetical protein